MMSFTAKTTAAVDASSALSTIRSRHSKLASFSHPQLCKSLPATAQTIDLSELSPRQSLVSLRFLVLSHLSDLEQQLSELESPDFGAWKIKGEIKIEEARIWAKTALDMLNRIRAEILSHFPDVHFADVASVERFLSAHIPELPEISSLVDVYSHFPEMSDVHLPEMPRLPGMSDMRAHIPVFADICSKLDNARTCSQIIDSRKLFDYVPTLSLRLHSLHSHLFSTEVEFAKMLGIPSLAPILRDVLDALSSSDLVAELTAITVETEEQIDVLIEKVAYDVGKALKHSLEGMSLITYQDLPEAWKNNPFVTRGYRFIPLERWPLLVKSLFTLHNEILNIHTHLIPFILYVINIILLIQNPTHFDVVEVYYMSFACICLLGSAIWHTMVGCAHHGSMQFCARVDYVGIGWLISASAVTVVQYGYRCHSSIGHAFKALYFTMGLLGNILPFMDWFNKSRYRFYRISFFLAFAFSGIASLIGMSILHSFKEMLLFVEPILPSFIFYLVGVAFYAYRWPERYLPENVRNVLDHFGANSHTIWHCLIVLAINQHRYGMQSMKNGLPCLADYRSA